jgi:hypothetical protein
MHYLPTGQFIRSEYLKHALTCFKRKVYVHCKVFSNGEKRLINKVNAHSLSDDQKDKLLTALYVGSFLIALAYIYSIHTNIFRELVDFFTSMTLSAIPGTGISLPAPAYPAAHMNLYAAAFQLTLALGILEVVILSLRIAMHSSVSKKAETAENVVLWLGVSFLIMSYLVNMTMPSEWFVFWAGVILIFGLANVARAFIILAKR